MRVKLIVGLRNGSKDGITPAHAGKTKAIVDGKYTLEDHPRACG